MATMNTAAPLPELRMTIVAIHPAKPEQCPDCGALLNVPCDCADNVPDGVEAFRCAGIGHRVHAFRGVAL